MRPVTGVAVTSGPGDGRGRRGEQTPAFVTPPRIAFMGLPPTFFVHFFNQPFVLEAGDSFIWPPFRNYGDHIYRTGDCA